MWKLTAREQKLLLLLSLLLVAGLVLRFTLADAVDKTGYDLEESPGEEDSMEFSRDAFIQEEEIIVHVVGGVHKPGVYTLSPGSRVFEAIQMAGGSLHEDLLEGTNLAQPLYDGQQVIVPREKGETESIETASQDVKNVLLNINRATRDELENLPGIGPVKAADIIDFREKNGPFHNVQDLTRVRGIGTKTLENIESYITIY